MPPKRTPKRKKTPLKFNQAYFEKNKKWFNPAFLRTPRRERSGMLAKYFRKLDLVERKLANAERWMKGLLEKDNVDFDEVIRKKFDCRAAAKSLFADAAKIFSEDYGKAITNSLFAHTQDQKDLHACHQHLYKMEKLVGFLRP